MGVLLFNYYILNNKTPICLILVQTIKIKKSV